jgi:hypothetical protein
MKFLLALMGLLAAGPLPAAEAVFVGEHVWRLRANGLGGLSGLEVSQNGASFVAVSDKGRFVTGRFLRHGDVITDVTDAYVGPIRTVKGPPVGGYDIDAEGLAQDAEGRLYVSFEANDRVRLYPTVTDRAVSIPVHPDFYTFQENSSLEALAVGADGTIYTIPERSGEWDRPFPVYRYRGGAWDQPFTVPRRDKFLVVGADIGPDGMFYLLEREFLWYGGFATRIRRFSMTETGFDGEETLLTTGYGRFDNLEGLSVWRDAAGAIRLTMVSDDNFSRLQVTEFVEYRVAE